MKKFAITAGIAMVLLIISVLTYLVIAAQNLQPALNQRKSVEAIARELVDRKLLPSVSFAVLENHIVTQQGFTGLVDSESHVAVAPHTLYEAASLTKPLIAELARRQFRQGVFDLDEPIVNTLTPARIADRKAFASVTPRHLLAHTSGLPNWSGDSRDQQRSDPLNLDFTPGNAFQYSGEGYGILLAFLEAKSGRSITALATDLFDELGMTHSTLTAASYVPPGSVRSEKEQQRRYIAARFTRGHWGNTPGREAWKSTLPIAAYSLFTNASDYGRFLHYVVRQHRAGVHAGDPFTSTHITIEQGVDAQTGANWTLGWSLGWGTLQDNPQNDNRTIYFQWGDNGAFRSFAAFDPVTGDGIVYFTNGSFGTLYANKLSAPVLGNLQPATAWFANPYIEVARTWIGY